MLDKNSLARDIVEALEVPEENREEGIRQWATIASAIIDHFRNNLDLDKDILGPQEGGLKLYIDKLIDNGEIDFEKLSIQVFNKDTKTFKKVLLDALKSSIIHASEDSISEEIHYPVFTKGVAGGTDLKVAKTTKILSYTPSTGTLTASNISADTIGLDIFKCPDTIDSNITIEAVGDNYMTIGPTTIAEGVTVTLEGNWVII
jgi:hypothetical protein